MNECYSCEYRGTVPGSRHSCCKYPGTKHRPFDFFMPQNIPIARELNIKAHEQGVRRGWFLWPCDFDPTWLENCDGYTPEGTAVKQGEGL